MTESCWETIEDGDLQMMMQVQVQHFGVWGLGPK